jgi:hypothetical protein
MGHTHLIYAHYICQPKMLYLKIANTIFTRGREDRGASRTLSIPEIGFTLGSVTDSYSLHPSSFGLLRYFKYYYTATASTVTVS